jgi:hypothetical protein
MAVFAFSIEKNTPWRGQTQGFSNVYHYDLNTDEPSEAVLDSILTQLKSAEQAIHATTVNFAIGRAWGPVANDGSGGRMRLVKNFTGTGTATNPSGWYKELAFLVIFPLGRYGERNRPQFLRKWLRLQQDLGFTATYKDGSTAFASTPASINTYANAVKTVTQGSGGPPTSLCNAAGNHSADTHQLYPYLEHRQFGR